MYFLYFSVFSPEGSSPSPEVQLPDVCKQLLGVADAEAVAARRKQDYIEQLEAANAELRAQWQVQHLERSAGCWSSLASY